MLGITLKKGYEFAVVNHRAIKLAVVLVLIMSSAAFAEGGIGDLGNRSGDMFKGLAQGAKYLFIFVGFCSAGGSIFVFMSMKKPGSQTPAWIPISMLVGGVVLVSLGAFISMGSTTMFGSDESGTGMSDLGL